MLASIVSNYKNKFVFIIIVCLLSSFLLLNSKVTSAQTPASSPSTDVATLQAMINNLMAQIAYLQSLLHQPTPTPDRVLFEVGMDIETTANLNVRSAPSITAPFLGLQKKGSQGVIVEGPVTADNHDWYKVDYVSGFDGWNAAGWLKNKVNIVDRNNICTADAMICPDGRSVGRSGPSCQFICPAPGSYSLSDVSYVTRTTTGNHEIDGGVYTYTIVLTNDKSYQVTVYDREQFASREAKFRATGYTGDVKKLMAMATAVETKPTPRFDNLTVNSRTVAVKAVFGINGKHTVNGPITIGHVNWGDSSTNETVSALANKDQITVNLKHTYKNPGTYTIKLTGLDGKTVSKKVVVKPITPIAGVPVCNSITANPKVIVSGATSTLTWITTNATKATIRQANLNQALQVSPNRSMLVNPNKTSRFILTLTNAKGVSHCEATVQVNSGAVLGASTDIYDEIGNILLKISSLLDELKN